MLNIKVNRQTSLYPHENKFPDELKAMEFAFPNATRIILLLFPPLNSTGTLELIVDPIPNLPD
jgi:hypothetical protein